MVQKKQFYEHYELSSYLINIWDTTPVPDTKTDKINSKDTLIALLPNISDGSHDIDELQYQLESVQVRTIESEQDRLTQLIITGSVALGLVVAFGVVSLLMYRKLKQNNRNTHVSAVYTPKPASEGNLSENSDLSLTNEPSKKPVKVLWYRVPKVKNPTSSPEEVV